MPPGLTWGWHQLCVLGLVCPADGSVGGVGWEGGGEHGLAVRAEDALGDERGDGGADGLLAQCDTRVVG